MDSVAAVAVDAAVWAAWSGAVGYVGHRLPTRRLASDGWITRLRPFERDGRFYERFGVRRWKDHLPDGGRLFGDERGKRHLPGRGRAALEAFACETRRGELVHWLGLAPAPLFALWNPPMLSAAMLAYALAANLPCLVVQRYNRARIARVLRPWSSPSPATA